jgi:ribosome-associated toxin RatA of RatAB toxin-antitoxin module
MSSLTRLSSAVLFAASLLALVASAPRHAQAQANLQSVTDALKDGSIQVTTVPRSGSDVTWGRAVGLVDAPIDDVMAVVQNYGGYQDFMPHFKTSKVLSQRGSTALVYMQASIAKDTVTLWAQLKVGPSANKGSTRVITAKMMNGNMNAMEAVWELTSVDANRTVVAFQLVMDPKLPLPDSFISSENEKASKKTIQALRKVVATRIKLIASKR